MLTCPVPAGGLHSGRTQDWRRREVGSCDLQYCKPRRSADAPWLLAMVLRQAVLPPATRHSEHSKGWAAGMQGCVEQGGNRPSSLGAGMDQSFSPCLDQSCRAAAEEGRVGVKGLWTFPLLAMKSPDMSVAPAPRCSSNMVQSSITLCILYLGL